MNKLSPNKTIEPKNKLNITATTHNPTNLIVFIILTPNTCFQYGNQQ